MICIDTNSSCIDTNSSNIDILSIVMLMSVTSEATLRILA